MMMPEHNEEGNTMEIRLPYEATRTAGVERLLKALQTLFPTMDLYSISTGWLESREYIAKARGTAGDVIVLWM
jgi:hypothetical protein